MTNNAFGDSQARASGLLLGISLGNGWQSATEVALCVADAAATGLPLDDLRAVDLLRRNLRSRPDAAPTGITSDAVLAACAVVAAAHHRDGVPELRDALAAVLTVLEVPVGEREGPASWTGAVSAVVATGRFDPTALTHSGRWAMYTRGATDAAAFVPGASVPAPSAGEVRSANTTAATGALVGALLGATALPSDELARLSGWPDADAASLMRIAADVAAPRDRGLPGGPMPVSVLPHEFDAPPALAPAARTWRRVRIALSARDPKEIL